MTPHATYRLQFRKEFNFEDACAVVPYLARLGISHVYASPILAARKGSPHGYDVVDHARINDELGGEERFRKLVATLKAHGLALIADIVPNHMAVGKDNAWWVDVLEYGRASAHAHFFDIDWEPPDPTLQNKVLLPVLAAPLADTLTRGELSVVRGATGNALLAYAEHRFPLRPEDQESAPDDVGQPNALCELLERQHYRLAWWCTAGDLINWRRFFDINDLVALRMEDDAVFEAVHAKVLALYGEGLIDGFRVDHVDGLADPRAYCRKLRARLDDMRPGGYLVVEKILAPGETLPDDWGVDGTTGYDFMNDVSAVLHDPAGAQPLARAWADISGRAADFHAEEREARRELLHSKFHGAFETAARSLFATVPRVAQDMTEGAFQRALMHLLTEFRIYRTYATGCTNSPALGQFFDTAMRRALQRASANDVAAMQHIVWTMQGHGEEDSALRRIAVRRFNQLAASLAAKAGEDTAFYRYGVLLSRNEVGSDPDEFALTPHEFHVRACNRLKAIPLLATATHDHKRGEDARMRLAVLSELSTEWLTNVGNWFEINTPIRDSGFDAADEYQLYQTLVGSWPSEFEWQDLEKLTSFRERILVWQLKSLHEAKLRSSWGDPDKGYDDLSAEFTRRLLDPHQSGDFLQRLSAFVDRIAPAAALNGLVQTILRCTTPGVPDLYQGTEFWDFSLVDPDNRRPVDFEGRAAAIAGNAKSQELLRDWRTGEIKQHVIAKLLALRRRQANSFLFGDYRPLESKGLRAENVIGFARCHGRTAIVVAVPRLCALPCIRAGRPLPDPAFWGDTTLLLPAEFRAFKFRSVFDPDSGRIAGKPCCTELFGRFPSAVLVSD